MLRSHGAPGGAPTATEPGRSTLGNSQLCLREAPTRVGQEAQGRRKAPAQTNGSRRRTNPGAARQRGAGPSAQLGTFEL